ncbi:MAG: hypothetical protein AAF432_12710 [Planctomycetota bacterium]
MLSGMILTALLTMVPASAPADVTTAAVADLQAKDRTVQTAAVEALIADCDADCEAALIELWTTTERYDVIKHIVAVFDAKEIEGLLRLVDHETHWTIGSDADDMVSARLAEYGDAAVGALHQRTFDGIETCEPMLWRVVGRLKIDQIPLARHLQESASPAIRQRAIRKIIFAVDRVDIRSQTILHAMRDPDRHVRSAAMAHSWVGVWLDDEKRAMPEEYKACRIELESIVLARDDHEVLPTALMWMAANGDVSGACRDIMYELAWDSTVPDKTRRAALKCSLLYGDDLDTNLSRLIGMASEKPRIVRDVITSVHPSLLNDEQINAIVGIGIDQKGFDYIIPTRRMPNAAPYIGVRALPAL